MSEVIEAENNYGLCIEDCDFLEDKTIWVAVLSNGLTVYQDDNRSGKEKVAWKRLGRYCSEKHIDVIGMYLKFRSHVKRMPDGDDIEGYYFAYGAHREFDETITRAYYVCGCVVNGLLNYEWYSTPELVKSKKSTREIIQEDIDSGKLILKTKQ